MQTESATPPSAPDDASWAESFPIVRASALPAGVPRLNVAGRRPAGPLEGFGPLLRKTYSIRIGDSAGAAPTPAQVVETWKASFADLWPPGNRFHAPPEGIVPGAAGTLSVGAGPMRVYTGVVVLYADSESFAFLPVQGHMFAGIIVFSAHGEGGSTIARVQPLIRTSDPLWDVSMLLFGYKAEDLAWSYTLKSLARRFGVEAEPTMEAEVVDPRRRWGRIGNVRHNAAAWSTLYLLLTPVRWARGRL